MNSDKRADSLGKTRNYHPLYMISILQTLKLLKLQGLHMLVCYTANCIISAVRRCSGGSLHRRPSIEHPPKSISPASTEDLLAKIIQQGPLRTFQRRLFTPRASMPAIHRSIHSANLPYWAPTNCRPGMFKHIEMRWSFSGHPFLWMLGCSFTASRYIFPNTVRLTASRP